MLRDLIAPRYYGTPQLALVWDALDRQLEAAQDAIDDVLAQLDLDTATWGLTLWERDYGLTPDVSERYAERRDRLRSHIRGAGTTTVELLQNLTEAYTGGETAVDDLQELWRLIVTFTGTIGVPSNMADLEAAVRAARPAHMDVEYVILYNLWRTLATRTWGEVGTRTWHDAKEVAF